MAAAIERVMKKHYNLGAKFTLTVTVDEIVVPGVPFVTRGAQAGYQMSDAFWKVSPP